MDRGRAYDWQMVFVGVVGVALTVLLVNPGEHTVGVGTVRFDPFSVPVIAFLAVTLWSVLGLRRSDTRS